MNPVLEHKTLIGLEAALQAGASPSEALAATCTTGPLADAARDVRLGRPVTEVAQGVATGNPAADFLVRALALAERTGGGAAAAVAHALDAIAEETSLERLIRVRTTQARGTAAILAGIPVVTWAVLVLADTRTLRFYANPWGALTALAAVVMGAASWRCMRRMAAACAQAARTADPLAPAASPPRWRRAVLPSAGTAIVGVALLGAAGGLAAVVVAAVLARPPRVRPHPQSTGGAEVVDLLAVALTTGLPVAAALEEVARIAGEPASSALRPVTARLAAGWRIADAFAGSPLAFIGEVVVAGLRWGAPIAPPLRRLAADLRSQRRALVEVAAERLQLALVFPTTLLTLPAFVLGVVPPLLWTTLQR